MFSFDKSSTISIGTTTYWLYLIVKCKFSIVKAKVKKVDIQKNITMPVLSVIAKQDDLVSPASSLAINDYIASKDKSVLENPGGHVALCISNTAHKKLWPEVAKWLLSRRTRLLCDR